MGDEVKTASGAGVLTVSATRIIKSHEVARLKWAGHVARMPGNETGRVFMTEYPSGQRKEIRPKLR